MTGSGILLADDVPIGRVSFRLQRSPAFPVGVGELRSDQQVLLRARGASRTAISAVGASAELPIEIIGLPVDGSADFVPAGTDPATVLN